MRGSKWGEGQPHGALRPTVPQRCQPAPGRLDSGVQCSQDTGERLTGVAGKGIEGDARRPVPPGPACDLLLSLQLSKDEKEQKVLVVEEARVAAQKEASELRASLRDTEQAWADTRRVLQEARRQVGPVLEPRPTELPGSLTPSPAPGPAPELRSLCRCHILSPHRATGRRVLPQGSQISGLKLNGLKQPF